MCGLTNRQTIRCLFEYPAIYHYATYTLSTFVIIHCQICFVNFNLFINKINIIQIHQVNSSV